MGQSNKDDTGSAVSPRKNAHIHRYMQASRQADKHFTARTCNDSGSNTETTPWASPTSTTTPHRSDLRST